MWTYITFCWTRQLFKNILTGPVAFGGRDLCVLILHSAGPDSYLTLLWLVPWHLEGRSYVYLYYILLDQTVIYHYFIGPVTFGRRELCVLVLHSAGQDGCLALRYWPRDVWRAGVMCTCIIFCWIGQLFNTTLTAPVAFGERELCVFVLHSARWDSYLTLLWLVPWYLVDESYVYLYYILLDQTVI
jgi:hypothetical protein